MFSAKKVRNIFIACTLGTSHCHRRGGAGGVYYGMYIFTSVFDNELTEKHTYTMYKHIELYPAAIGAGRYIPQRACIYVDVCLSVSEYTQHITRTHCAYIVCFILPSTQRGTRRIS